MLELLKKDLGMCRLLLIGGFLAVTVPYLFFTLYSLYGKGLTAEETRQLWGMSLLAGSQFSVILSIVSIPFLGGYIVAGERREQTAEFLAYLPVPKTSILISKSIVCLIWSMFAATVYFVMVQLVIPALLQDSSAALSSNLEGASWMASMTAAMFGVSWMLSCMIKSPVLAVVGGLCTPFVVLAIAVFLSMQFGFQIDQTLSPYDAAIVFGAIAITAFAIGSIYFVKRIEP